MKNVVVYFTRSGGTRRIAQKIAKKLECKTIEIVDDVSWRGFLGFMRGVYYSFKKKTSKITHDLGLEAADDYNVILAVPFWAGRIAPAGYAFLTNEYGKIENLHMVICSGSNAADEVYDELEAQFGPIAGKYGIVANRNEEDKIIDEICTALGRL